MVLMRLCVYRFAETLSRVSFQRRGSSVLPGDGAGIADPPVLENPAGEGGGGVGCNWTAKVVGWRGSPADMGLCARAHDPFRDPQKNVSLSFKIRRRRNKVLGQGNVLMYNRNIFFFFYIPMQLQNRSVNIFYGGSGLQRPKCLRPPEVILHPRWLRGTDSGNRDRIRRWSLPLAFLGDKFVFAGLRGALVASFQAGS